LGRIPDLDVPLKDIRLETGLHYTLPFGIERIRLYPIGRVPIKLHVENKPTADDIRLPEADGLMFVRVSDPRETLRAVEGKFLTAVKDVGMVAMSQEISNRTLKQLSGDNGLSIASRAAENRIRSKTADWGIKVEFDFQSVEQPEAISQAMEEARAERERSRVEIDTILEQVEKQGLGLFGMLEEMQTRVRMSENGAFRTWVNIGKDAAANMSDFLSGHKEDSDD
jgi:regulator of protease activity HflC (stomatin/prohibitin superfamily)